MMVLFLSSVWWMGSRGWIGGSSVEMDVVEMDVVDMDVVTGSVDTGAWSTGGRDRSDGPVDLLGRSAAGHTRG